MTGSESIDQVVVRFVAHKRAHGRKYNTEEAALRLLVRFCGEQTFAGSANSRRCCWTSSWSRGRARGRAASTICSGAVRLSVGLGGQPAAARGLTAARPQAPGDGGSDPVHLRRRPGTAAARGGRRAARQLAGAAARARPTTRSSRSATGSGCAPARRAGCASAMSTRPQPARGAGRQVRQEPAGSARPADRRVARRAARTPHRRRPARRGAPLFTFDGRRCVHPCTASQTFHQPRRRARLPVPDGVSPPVLHSLRHSFAVGCLLRWYRQGLDPAARLHQLSTFMGHVDPVSTAVYLTITPALLEEANRRFEAFAEPAWTAMEPDDEPPTAARAARAVVLPRPLDHGQRPSAGSVRSYRDTIRLLLLFLAAEKRSRSPG